MRLIYTILSTADCSVQSSISLAIVSTFSSRALRTRLSFLSGRVDSGILLLNCVVMNLTVRLMKLPKVSFKSELTSSMKSLCPSSPYTIFAG